MGKAFAPDHSPPEGSPPQPTGPTCVLVVDPLGERLAALACIFRGSNWVLVRAGSHEEGLVTLRERPVPVAICDADSPSSDWKVFCREARKLPIPPRLLVSSRFADDTLWAEAVGVGAEDVLPAPFESAEVLRLAFIAWCAWEHAQGRPVSGQSRWSRISAL